LLANHDDNQHAAATAQKQLTSLELLLLLLFVYFISITNEMAAAMMTFKISIINSWQKFDNLGGRICKCDLFFMNFCVVFFFYTS
jgi:hypothetical protein